jgi:hypothetical protein
MNRLSHCILCVLLSWASQLTLSPSAIAETLIPSEFKAGQSISPIAATVNDDVDTVIGRWGFPIGDYNLNGIVDAADYTIWRDRFGSSVYPGFGADGNNTGVVDPFDRLVWRANFGVRSPGTSVASISEPTAVSLLTVALGVVAVQRQRRRTGYRRRVSTAVSRFLRSMPRVPLLARPAVERWYPLRTAG